MSATCIKVDMWVGILRTFTDRLLGWKWNEPVLAGGMLANPLCIWCDPNGQCSTLHLYLEHVSMIVWCRTLCHHASRNVAFHDIVMTCTHARTHACTLEQLACMPMTPQYVIVAYGSCMFAQMCVDLNAFVGAWSSSKIDRSKLCRWCRKSMQPTYVRYVTRLTGHTGSQMHHVVGWIHNKLAVPQEDVMFTTRLHNRCVWSSFNCMHCY